MPACRSRRVRRVPVPRQPRPALEFDGKPTAALDLYRASLKAEPRYTLAAERALVVLKSQHPDRTGEARAKAARGFLDVPNLPPATTRLITLDLLAAWKDDGPAAKALLPYLVHYLAAAHTTPAIFEADEWPALSKLNGEGGLDPLMKELRDVFIDKEFGRGTDPLKAHPATALPKWSPVLNAESMRSDFARLLHTAADDFRRQSRASKEPPLARTLAVQAIQRDTVAFELDHLYTDALEGAFNTFVEHSAALDPGGEILVKYADKLFNEKSELLLRAKTADQYRSLRSMHLTLAAIGAKQGWWKEAGNDRYRSVPFQLRMAVQAEDEIRKREPTYTVSPDLSVRLADVLEKGGNKAGAAEAYCDAADRYLTAGAPKQAAEVLKQYAVRREQVNLPAAAALPRVAALTAETAGREPVAGLKTKGVPTAVAFLSDGLVGYGTGDKLVGWKVGEEMPGAGQPWSGAVLAANPKTGDFLCDGGFSPERAAMVDWWAVSGGNIVKREHVGEHPGGVRAVAVSADGALFASAGVKGGVRVISKGGPLQFSAAGPLAETRGIAVRDRDAVVVAGRGGVVALSLGAKDQGKTIWKADPYEVAECVAASADGTLVAAGFSDGEVRVYDGANGKRVKTFKPSAGAVRAVAFANGSNLLATLGADPAVRVYEPTTGREVARYGHPRRPVGMAFSADGKQLVIASDDLTGGAIRVWPVPGK